MLWEDNSAFKVYDGLEQSLQNLIVHKIPREAFQNTDLRGLLSIL